MAYRTVLMAARGDPGIFGSIGRAIGSVSRFLPGPLGAIGGVIGTIAGSGGGGAGAPSVPSMSKGRPQAGPGGVVPVPGVMGTVERFLPGGRTGYTTNRCLTKTGHMRRIRKDGQCWKRPTMNVLNPKAARRAITRIKGARRLLHAIESQLPHRKAARSSGGRGRSCGCK